MSNANVKGSKGQINNDYKLKKKTKAATLGDRIVDFF